MDAMVEGKLSMIVEEEMCSLCLDRSKVTLVDGNNACSGCGLNLCRECYGETHSFQNE